jgi:hypothetical protein
MTTIHELDTINAEAMMTLSEIGFAAYERFRDKAMADDKGSMLRIKLKSWVSDRFATERDLELRIKCAPMYKPMA